MSYFVQVITIVMVALLYTKCISALNSTNYEHDNMCTKEGPDPDVNTACPGNGECQLVSIDFSNEEEWQTRLIGICFPHEDIEETCITRSSEWPLYYDDEARRGIVCKVFDDEPMKKDDPFTEKDAHKTARGARGSTSRASYRSRRRTRWSTAT